MPKPKDAVKEIKKEESKLDSKTLPQVLDQKFDRYQEVVQMMEELAELQEQVGVKPDDNKGKEGSGWLKRMHELKKELSIIMGMEGLTGLRHNNLVFTDQPMPGRYSLDVKSLRIELMQDLNHLGVTLEMIDECIKRATKEGEGYFRRQLRDISKPQAFYYD